MARKRIIFELGYFPCDACGTKALDAWYKTRTGQLFTFCGHHGLKHYRALQDLGFKIIMTVAGGRA